MFPYQSTQSYDCVCCPCHALLTLTAPPSLPPSFSMEMVEKNVLAYRNALTIQTSITKAVPAASLSCVLCDSTRLARGSRF